jgi:hypothetical protein
VEGQEQLLSLIDQNGGGGDMATIARGARSKGVRHHQRHHSDIGGCDWKNSSGRAIGGVIAQTLRAWTPCCFFFHHGRLTDWFATTFTVAARSCSFSNSLRNGYRLIHS